MNNEMIFAVVALLNSVILVFSMTNLLIRSPKKSTRVVVIIYLLACQLCFGRSMGQNITFFTIGGAFLLVILMEKHPIANTVMLSLGYLLAVTINYILTVPLNLLGYTLAFIAGYPYILIFMAVYGPLSLTASFFLGRFIKNFFKKYYPVFPLKLQILFLFQLLFCVTICIYNIIQGGKENFPPKVVYFNSVLFITFFLITLVIFFFCLHIMRKNS